MTPSFRDSSVLRNHVQDTIDFYHPRCIDPSGGFYHYFKDDGQVYDRSARHLVGSTRFVFNYAMAFRHFGRPEPRRRTPRHEVPARCPPQSGHRRLRLLDTVGERRGRRRRWHEPLLRLGLRDARLCPRADGRPGRGGQYVSEVFELAEAHFWEPQHGLYADEASADWTLLAAYRGQ